LSNVKVPAFSIGSRLTDGGKVVSLYLPGRFLALVFVKGLVDPRAIVRLEGLGQLKNPVTSGLELATFWLVTQCLNQLRYRVSPV
jgi:hypothetical protein